MPSGGSLAIVRLAAIAAILALVLAPRSAHAEDTLDAVRARGELVWAGDIQGGEPYVYEDPKDPSHLIGFEVEIAEALAKRLGVRARFAPFQWSNLVPSLERGDFDVAMNGLEATPERERRILLSRPYFVYGETLAVRRKDSYRTLEDLRGGGGGCSHSKRVATLNQTYAAEVLKARGIETVFHEGVQEPYLDLVAGRVDGVLLDHVIADRYGCMQPEVLCVEGDVARGVYVIGIRKSDVRLKAAIDGAIGQMIADGELQRILEGWKLWDARQADLDKPRAVTDLEAKTRLDRAQLVLFLKGALVTLLISIAAFAMAMPLGLTLAIARLYFGAVPRAIAATYVEIFRGTPVLLQLYVLYYGLAPIVKIGALPAAILGLGLNYAAYEAEVYRGALRAIPRGQIEAASALGLTRWQTLRHVAVPQALKNALPAVTNDFVALLKDSSLVSVITVVELTKRFTIASVEIGGWLVPGILCAAFYFAMSFPLSRLSHTLEKRLHRDSDPRLT